MHSKAASHFTYDLRIHHMGVSEDRAEEVLLSASEDRRKVSFCGAH